MLKWYLCGIISNICSLLVQVVEWKTYLEAMLSCFFFFGHEGRVKFEADSAIVGNVGVAIMLGHF